MTAVTPGREELLARIELALTQAQSCIKGETPEDITFGEAEDDTFSKIRDALDDVAELRRIAAEPTADDDIARIKVQRDNALLDMERFMKEAEGAREALQGIVDAWDTFKREELQLDEGVAQAIEAGRRALSTTGEPKP